MPGAQLPQREYVVEPTSLGADGRPRGKGYRIVPSLDPNVSAIERALSNEGFSYYMPVERRLVRDRKKTDLWKPRRFALLLGYVFVKDVEDWVRLEETAGIASIVRNQGRPMAIPAGEIEMLRVMEAEAEAKLHKLIEQREAAARRLPRRKASGLFPPGSFVDIVSGPAEGRVGFVTGSDRDGRLKMLVQSLEMSVPMDAVKMVA
jgi:transcription antitermination factor NusG